MARWMHSQSFYNLFILSIIVILLNSAYLWYNSSNNERYRQQLQEQQQLQQQRMEEENNAYYKLHPSLVINRNIKNIDDKDVIYPFLHNYDPIQAADNPNYEPVSQPFRKESWTTSSGLKKRKVCLVTTEIEGPVLGGGIGTAYTALAQRLQSDGHRVTVLLVNQVKKLTAEHWIDLYKQRNITLVILDLQQKTNKKSSTQNEKVLTVAGEEVDPVMAAAAAAAADGSGVSLLDGVAGCTGPCLRSYKTYEWLREQEEHLNNHFDVIHFHDNGGIGYFSTLARHQGWTFTTSVIVIGGHGPHLWERTANSANLDDGKHFEVDYLERRAVEMSDWLISPSNYMLNWMRRNGWILPRNSYVHQNLLPPTSQSDVNNIDREMTRSFDEIIFFGRLESRKGLDIFIRAVERLVDRIKQGSITITFLGANTKLTEINMMADHYIANKCHRLDIKCHILIGKSHTEAIQYLTFEREKKLIVIPSPIDNSPNTVLECLTHRLAFIASQVGGIPELIHPDDRQRSLFHPKPASLFKKLSQCLDSGVKPAKMAIDEWTRQRIWSNWHSIVRLVQSPSIQQQKGKDNSNNIKNNNNNNNGGVKVTTTPFTYQKISIVLVYDDTNKKEFIKSLQSLDDQLAQDETLGSHLRIELVVAISTLSSQSTNTRSVQQQFLGQLTSKLQMAALQQPKVCTVSEYLVDQWYQPWNSKNIQDTVTGDYILFIDKYDWPTINALQTIFKVEEHTNADLISSSLQYDNISTVTSITGVYMGCLGMNGILYNCYGANNVFMKRAVLDTIGRRLENQDVEDELDHGGAWELYAEATNKGYFLETIPKSLFKTNKNEIDGSSTYNQELRVMKYFEAILPPSMGLAPLATRHFLISKSVYLSEIVNVQQRSKQLQIQCDKNKGGGIKEVSSDIIAFEDMESTNLNPMMESRDHIGLLFVRGHEKSGTSWLKKVLNLHPRILLAQQEFHFHLLEDALEKFTDSHWAAAREPYNSVTRKWYRSFVRNLILSGVSPATAPLISWVGEKTPSPLSPLISGARYIVIIRDGRDVLVSLFWHYVRLGGFEGWCGGQSKHLVDPIYVSGYRQDPQYFKQHPNQLLEKEVCFRHVARSWANRAREDLQLVDGLAEMKDPPTRVYVVRYEELHRHPDETRADMYRFLDLDPDEAEQLSTDDKTSPGGFQEEGDNKNKFFRKGEIGDWQNYFTKNQKQWFKEEAGSILIQLGYELDNNW